MAVTVKEYIPSVNEKPKVEIESDKTNHKWIVEKTEDGFIFYGVRVTSGKLPPALQCRFSTMKAAVDAVKAYEDRMTPTPRRRRDEKREEKEAS